MGTNADSAMSIEQRTAVSKVRIAADNYRIARDTLERQLRDELMLKLQALMAVRDNEVRIAYAMGVKKATLKRAIGSKDHATLQNIISIGGAVGLPESEMITWNGVETFTVNFVDYLGSRIYGSLVCNAVFSEHDTPIGFEVPSGDSADPIWELLERTTGANDFTVYDLIVNAIG
jgi:hypothetical protein